MTLCSKFNDTDRSVTLKDCRTEQDQKGKDAVCDWCGEDYLVCTSDGCGPNTMTACSAKDWGDDSCFKSTSSLGTCSKDSIEQAMNNFGQSCYIGDKKLCCRWNDCQKYCSGPQSCGDRVKELMNFEEYSCERALEKVRQECPLGDCDKCDFNSCKF